ncbi:MAG: hypothetical protein Q7P63_00585 [Verrucomicrobiota bacterium JB022]|nr:hypothetical protein [Verrucomicrobiota bacterium JB022]
MFTPALASAATVQTFEALAAFEDDVDVQALNGLIEALEIPFSFDTVVFSNSVLTLDFNVDIDGQWFDGNLRLDLSDALKDTNLNGIPDEAELALASQWSIPVSMTMVSGIYKVVANIDISAQRGAGSSTIVGTLNMSATYYERGRAVDYLNESQSLYYDLNLASWYGAVVPADTHLESYDVDANFYRKDDSTLVVRNFIHRGYPVDDVELAYTGSAYVGQFYNETLQAPYYLSISNLNDADGDGIPDLTDVDAQGFLYGKAGGDLQGGWKKLGHFGWFWGPGLDRDWYYSDKLKAWVWLEDGEADSFLIYQSGPGWLYTSKTLGVYYRYSDGHWLDFANEVDGRIKFWDFGAGAFVWFDK